MAIDFGRYERRIRDIAIDVDELFRLRSELVKAGSEEDWANLRFESYG